MKKEDINLLPPNVRKSRVLRVRLNRLRAKARWLNVIVVLLIVLGGFYYSFFKQNIYNLSLSINQTPNPSDDPIVKARDIDQALNAIQAETKRLPPRPMTLPDVLNVLPTGMSITSMTQDSATQKITLKGTAPTSEAVVEYKKKLMTLPWVKNVDLPLNNFTVPNNEFILTVIP